LGFQIPDQVMKQALPVPKVVAVNNGWRVSFPLGTPYAISWVHLDLDSSGRLLHHEFQRGE
jgi:hypothetical protein